MVLERDFPPDLRVENEINSLHEKGHQVFLACYTRKKEYIQEEWNKCKVFKKPISPIIYKSSVGALKFPFYFKFWKSYVFDICNKVKPDVIHIHDLPLASVGLKVKQKFGIKFVLDLHENWPAYLRVSKHANTFLGKLLSSNTQWENYEKKHCLIADKVIVVIDEAKARLRKMGIKPGKIEIVANYPELSDFDGLPEYQKKSDKLILFYAGGIGEHRGLQYIIQSLPSLMEKYPTIELRILGSGNYADYLKTLSDELNVSDHVIFYGQVPYRVVLEELVKAHVTLIPHVKNDHTDSTIPHKLFQYIYAGKPVLASNCIPIQRILLVTNAGKVYKWNDSEDAAEKLDWIINNLEFYKPKQLKNVIEKRYNWMIEKAKLQKIYTT